MGQPVAEGPPGPPTLGKAMLNKYARAFFTRVLTPFAALLLRRGVSPDAVTLIGTAGVVAGALVFYPRGEFFWGTVVITLFVFSDLVDGNMARQLGRSSRWGAFLDSTLDRVADGAIFGGLALWYAGGGDDNVLCAVAIFCLASGQVVSYTKARGESIGLPVARQRPGRARRAAGDLAGRGRASPGCTSSGCRGIEVLLPIALWIVAVGSLVTLVQRVVTVRRESAEADAARRGGDQGSEAVSEQPVAGDRLTDGAVRARLEHGQEAPRAGRRAPRAAPSPTPPGSGAARACGGWRPTWRAWCPTRRPERLAELSRAGMRSYLRYWMESFRLPAWSAERDHGRRSTSRTLHQLTDGLASGRGVDPRPAAPGQLGPGRAPGSPPSWRCRSPRSPSGSSPRSLYDRFVAYREGLGMEVLPHTGGHRLRHAGPAAARRRPGLPGRRPRPVRLRRRGDVLRRDGADARRARRCWPSRPARCCCR